MEALTPALELLRTLTPRLAGGGDGGAGSDGDPPAAAHSLPAAEADAKLRGVMRALSRAVGDDDAAHMVHLALFSAWLPVAELGTALLPYCARARVCVRGRWCVALHVLRAAFVSRAHAAAADTGWVAWPNIAPPRGGAALTTREYLSLVARHPSLVQQLVDQLMCALRRRSRSDNWFVRRIL
jgi:hypothetical protein